MTLAGLLFGSSTRPGAVVATAAAISETGLAITTFNALCTPRLSPRGSDPRTFDEPLTVVVPARNEERRLPELLADLRAQTGVPGLRVIVHDDNSTDSTASLAESLCRDDRRFAVTRGRTEPPVGVIGKPAACIAAFEGAENLPTTGVVVFLDADVRLHPNALATACRQARRLGVSLLTPWPYQRAESWTERLVQPLLAWSWAATLPVALANRDRRSSTVIACGQFLVFDCDAYRSIGGHRAVASSVTEDLDIARALRRSGYRTGAVFAGPFAQCRMYEDPRALREGYGRWLWTAFGTPTGAMTVAAVAVVAYVLPPVVVIAARGGPARRWAVAAYASAVGSRVLARTLEKGSAPRAADVIDAAAHPVSTIMALALTYASHRDRRRGRARWKGRPVS